MQKWEDDFKERLKGREIPPKYWELPELEKGNVHQNHCANCFHRSCGNTKPQINANQIAITNVCPMTSCKFGCGARYHACKTSEHLIICLVGEVEDDYSKMYQGVSGEQRRYSSGTNTTSSSLYWSDKYFSDSYQKICEKRKSLKDSSKGTKISSPQTFKSIGDLFEGPNEAAYLQRNLKSKFSVPDPPMTENLERNQLSQTLSLDLNFINEPRHVSKSKALYSFSCSQTFRRDQFEWHFKNVHDDILGGLNGSWLEQRCPLASYGCGFSVRRLHPLTHCNYQGHTSFRPGIIFNPIMESFGLSNKEINHAKQESENKRKDENDLPTLPCEILYRIFSYLDSFRYSFVCSN